MTRTDNNSQIRTHQKRGSLGIVMLNAMALLVVVFWGVSFINSKKLIDAGLGATEIYILRFTLAYLVTLIFSHSRIRSNSFKDEVLFFVCGLCGGTIYYISENMALIYTTATNVSILTATTPLFTAFIILAIYKSEKLGKGLIIGSIIAFIGVVLVVLNSFFSSSETLQINPLGDFLALLAAVSFAVYSIVVRRFNANYDIMFISRKTFFYGVLAALPFLSIDGINHDMAVFAEPVVWGNLLFLGLVCSMFAFIIWAEAVKSLGSVRASNYLYLPPIVTLFAAAIFLGETITIVGVSGCLLIIGGMYVSEKVKFKGDKIQSTTPVASRTNRPN